MDPNQPQIPSQPDNKSLPLPHALNLPLKIFLVGIMTLLIISAGGIGYYAGIYKTQKEIKQTSQNMPNIPEKTSPTPSISIPPDNQYEVINGSLFQITAVKPFLDKTSLKNDYYRTDDITTFKLSPDKSKMLLITTGSISHNIFYYVDIQSKKITFIGAGADETVWSPNSQYVAYTSPPADVGQLQLYVFDTVANKKIETIQPKTMPYYATGYSDLVWSSDSKSITAHYNTVDEPPYGKTIDEGTTEVTLK